MTSRVLTDYLSLITSEHAGKPNYTSLLTLILSPLISARELADAIPSFFDLDNAVGVQLDATGAWIGQSRFIPIPVADPWFRFDDVMRGFDSAVWFNPAYSQNDFLSALDDVTYKRLLRAKILSNNWDGTVPAAEEILNTYFINPATNVWIEDDSFAATQQDFFSFDDAARGFDTGVWFVPGEPISTLPNLDMSFTIGVSGQTPSITDLEILAQGLLPVKPGGVAQNIQVASVNGAAVFGFDVENEFISGFDVGAWGQTPAELVSTQLNG